MKELTVADAFASNDKVREKLIALVGELTPEQASQRDESQDKWSVAEIVEHISIVESGIAGLCQKLLTRGQAAGSSAAGRIRLSDEFLDAGEKSTTQKWQAPDRVRPTGTKTVAESLAAMDETRVKLEELRPMFEQLDSSNSTFPHPYLGELTAAEWLCLIGGHAARHMRQIRRILENAA